jgi:hypothetical protein
VVEQVDAPVVGRELAAHVLGGVDVDNTVTSALRTEDGEVAAAILHDLGVDTGAAAAQRPDELAHEAVAFELAEAGDHGEPGVQREREGVGPGFDDQSLEVHAE